MKFEPFPYSLTILEWNTKLFDPCKPKKSTFKIHSHRSKRGKSPTMESKKKNTKDRHRNIQIGIS